MFVLTVVPSLLFCGQEAFAHWQQTFFFYVAVVGGFTSGFSGFTLCAGERDLARQRIVVTGGAAFVFLYVACTALCARLNLGLAESEAFRGAGVIVIVAGSVLRIWAIATLGRLHSALVAIQPEHKLVRHGPYRYIRHPSYLGLTVFLAGIPMVFAAWFPLLAIPGCIVALRWRIMDEEAFLISEFGHEYESYKKGTWCMIPFIY